MSKKLAPTVPAHHPMQPIFVDDEGVIRFRQNALVRFLLDANGKIDMNVLAHVPASAEERAHFAQLIGYSVSGWGDLSYVAEGCPEWLAEADKQAEELCKRRR